MEVPAEAADARGEAADVLYRSRTRHDLNQGVRGERGEEEWPGLSSGGALGIGLRAWLRSREGGGGRGAEQRVDEDDASVTKDGMKKRSASNDGGSGADGALVVAGAAGAVGGAVVASEVVESTKVEEDDEEAPPNDWLGRSPHLRILLQK